MVLIEVKNSASTVQLKTTEGNYTDIDTNNTPRTNDLVIGDNLFSVRNKIGLTENLKGIKTINQLGDERLVIGAGIDIVESLAIIAPSGGKVVVTAEDTEDDFTQIKPAASGTYALEEWVNDSAWMLGGNPIDAIKNIGSTTNFNWNLIRNNNIIATVGANGLGIGTISPLSKIHTLVTAAESLTEGANSARIYSSASGTGTAGVLGANLIFGQRWLNSSDAPIRTGGISGYKNGCRWLFWWWIGFIVSNCCKR